MLSGIKEQAKQAAEELIKTARLKKGDVMVIGCSSSEIGGDKLGTNSSVETAQAVFEGIYPTLKENGIFLAAQCCEHLNRAVVIERAAAKMYGYDIVNAVPQPKAGGSFATTAYKSFESPVVVESVRADAGIDIGNVLIGMQLKHVAVPVRLTVKKIGQAPIVCARTRAKFVGGERAVYDEQLL